MDAIKRIISLKLAKYIYIAMFVTVLLLEPPFQSDVNKGLVSIYIYLFFAAVIINILLKEDKNWFRMDILFLLGFGIVHFQWPMMVGISNIEISSFQFLSYELSTYMNYSTWLSAVGIMAWFVGYSWSKKINKKVTFKYYINYKMMFWVTVIFFALFLSMAGSNFFEGGVYKGKGGSSAGAGLSIYFQILSGIAMLILTTAILLQRKTFSNVKIMSWVSKLDKKYIALLSIYILIYMSAGDRGTGLSIMMTFLIIFGCFIKEINLRQFIVIATIGAFILTLIGIGRTSDSGGGVLSSGIGSVSFASNYDVTLDLANSSRTLYMALSKVPSEHDYFFGKLWLGDLLASTPFAQGIYLEFSNDKAYEINSSAYITFITFGPNSTTGEGSTLIADIYLNFGVIGIIVSMFLLGLFLKKLQNELYLQQNFYWVITAGIMASYVFYMSRGGLLEGIRPILWGLILTIFFIKSKRRTL